MTSIPLNLPHAATVAYRWVYHLQRLSAPETLLSRAADLVRLLEPCRDADVNPPPDESKRLVEEAARIGREIVAEVERLGLGDDRLGLAVRNLFECLGLAAEGAQLSLRAGENPDSLLRPI